MPETLEIPEGFSQIISKYYHDEDFYYVNFEDERLLDLRNWSLT